MPEFGKASSPDLRALYSPLIYAAVSGQAVQEAETYDGACGVEFEWGHVRWEATPCRKSFLGGTAGDCVDWCVVVKRLQQATADKPHLHADAQRMLEQFARAWLGRRSNVRVEVAGPLCMLRLRIGAARAAATWSSLSGFFQLIPRWSSFIEQCLLEEKGRPLRHPALPAARKSTGELLQESQ